MNKTMTVRAKFVVSNVTPYRNDENSPTHLEHWEFFAVGGDKVQHGYPSDGSDEDNTFARWTPNAHLTMDVQNPALFGTLKVGQKYYVDLVLAEETKI